jgi:dolichol-phosphate mannosyltransferase
VILPTLNERVGLELMLRDLKSMRFPMKNVIVLDGHSTDGTIDVAKEHGTRIILQRGKGKGMAFQTFLEEFPIKEDAIYIMMDADYTYNPFEIPEFLKLMDRGYDVVSGNRKVFVHNLKSLLHLFAGDFLSILASFLYFRLNRDLCSGYWAFRGHALKKMKINAKGFDLEANLWAEVCKRKLKFANLLIDYRKRVGMEKIRPFDAVKIILRLFKEKVAG